MKLNGFFALIISLVMGMANTHAQLSAELTAV